MPLGQQQVSHAIISVHEEFKRLLCKAPCASPGVLATGASMVAGPVVPLFRCLGH